MLHAICQENSHPSTLDSLPVAANLRGSFSFSNLPFVMSWMQSMVLAVSPASITVVRPPPSQRLSVVGGSSPSRSASSAGLDTCSRYSALAAFTAVATTFSDVRSLERALTQHGVDLSGWGCGTAKTSADLLEELRQGETLLHFSEWRVRRWLNVVKVRSRAVCVGS